MRRFALSLLLLAGCDTAPAGPTAAQRAYEDASRAAVVAVEAAIGEARADDVASCRALPLGENNVGAPTFFRVYSTTDGDPARVLDLAARVADIDRQAIAAGVLDYPHATPPVPAVELRDGRCLPVSQAVAN